MVASLPIFRAKSDTKGEINPKHNNGIVVKIPKLFGATRKLVAISLITDGNAVIGIRMQTPTRSIPINSKELWFFFSNTKSPPQAN